jgi:pimeloyl-ACP methyl ester carboxylesterase
MDIFVSHAAEDRARVEPLVRTLESAGLSVWWDRQIDAGKTFDRTIEEELTAASCVLVVWTKQSVESNWVREEADEGLRRGILVPVQLEPCQIPLGFRRIQAAQFLDWPRSQRNLDSLIDRIGAVAGSVAVATGPPRRKSSRISLIALIFVGVIVLAVTYLYGGAVVSSVVLNAPGTFFGDPIEQEIGVATSDDGTKISYAVSGEGPPLVYVLGWMTHLEGGFNSPVYDNERLLAMTSERHLFVRYDGRGFGMSDRDIEDFSLEARVSDLEAVVDAAGLRRFAILAASSGGPIAIAFTVKYPKRVSALVLASTFASLSWGSEAGREQQRRFMDYVEVAWSQTPVREMFAAQALEPTGTAVERAVYAGLLGRCCDGPNVASYFRELNQVDLREQARRIEIPTLVLHARDDQAIPLDGGKEPAALIPKSSFKVVEGGHREGTASTSETREIVLGFLASVEARD